MEEEDNKNDTNDFILEGKENKNKLKDVEKNRIKEQIYKIENFNIKLASSMKK